MGVADAGAHIEADQDEARDEGADEHDRGQGQRERHSEDHERDADEHGVDEGHDGRTAHVATEDGHAAVADPAGLHEALALERAEHERPDLLAVLQEEEEDDHHEQGAREEVPRRAEPRE